MSGEPAFPLDSDAMRLLAEIGFMGAQSGQAPAARALFEALRTLRPQSTLPPIGLAQAALGANKPDEAVRILREALKVHAGDSELMSFLGVALHAAGQLAESHKVMRAVIEQEGGDDNVPCVRMAKKLLLLETKGSRPAMNMALWSTEAASAK